MNTDLNPEHWKQVLRDELEDMEFNDSPSRIARLVDLIDNLLQSRINEALKAASKGG